MSKKKKEAAVSSGGEPPGIGFEKALEQLQSIVRDLESGQLTLDQSLEKYEQGVQNLRVCHETLRKAEQRIRLLVDLDDNGRAITRPFAHSASFGADSPDPAGKPPAQGALTDAGSTDQDEDDDFDRELDDSEDAMDEDDDLGDSRRPGQRDELF